MTPTSEILDRTPPRCPDAERNHRHSIRQALRAGLVAPKFGSRWYVMGESVLEFVERLAQQQGENPNP